LTATILHIKEKAMNNQTKTAIFEFDSLIPVFVFTVLALASFISLV
jgi:hypothetical protein